MMAMVLSLIMLMAVPALASKSGGGGEGANLCPDDVALQNAPPAFTGWLHIIWKWGNGVFGDPQEYDGVYYQGDIVQGGKRGCSCSFPADHPWFYGTTTRLEFENMSPKGLVGICQSIGGTYQGDSGLNYYCTCNGEEFGDYFQISTVNRLQRLNADEWYGYVEIMRMKVKK